MRQLLSYCKSHIYDIHSVLAGTITFLLMLWLKGTIKGGLAKWVNDKAEKNAKWKENQMVYLKRCNGILIVLTMLLSCLIFLILSSVSPFVDFSLQSALMSGVFALTEYAVVDQISYGRKR